MAFFRKRTKIPGPDTPLTEPSAKDITLPRSAMFSSEPKIQQQQLKLDTHFLLGHESGLRYLSRLIIMSGALGGSYAPSSPYATAYNEGLRRMGLFIMADLQENVPELLPKLLRLCLPGTEPLLPEPEGTDTPLQ